MNNSTQLLTDDELDAIHAPMQNYAACNINIFIYIARAIESALLSKLRADCVPVAVTDHRGDVHWKNGRKPGITLYDAPVASATVDEPPGGTRWPVLRAMARNYTAGKHTWDALDAEACEQAAEEIRHLRAALASAPVAGEAQRLHTSNEVPAKMVDDLRAAMEGECDGLELRTQQARNILAYMLNKGAFYAAPQASEAVRILFPAHLRKMWSGGEVQAWLDEHQGVTPPPAAARGSLQRYRQWKADQAAPVCSCPSGDGSLRPCAVHPPTDARTVVLPPLPQTIAWATVNPSLAAAVDDLRRTAVLADRQQQAALSATQTEQGERDE